MDKNYESYLKKKLCVLSSDTRRSIKVGNHFRLNEIVDELELYSDKINYVQEIYYKIIKYIAFYQFETSNTILLLINLINNDKNIDVSNMKYLYQNILKDKVSPKIKYSNKLWKLTLNINFSQNYFSNYISKSLFNQVAPINTKYENLLILLKNKNMDTLFEVFIYSVYLINVNKINTLMNILSKFMAQNELIILKNAYIKTEDITFFYVIIMKIMFS